MTIETATSRRIYDFRRLFFIRNSECAKGLHRDTRRLRYMNSFTAAISGCLSILVLFSVAGAVPESACSPSTAYYSGKGVPFRDHFLNTRGEYLVYDNGGPLDDAELKATQYDANWPFIAEVADDFVLFGTETDQTQITRIQQWFGYFNVPQGHTPDPETDWSGVMVTIYTEFVGEPAGEPRDDGSHTNYEYTFIVPMSQVAVSDMSTFDCMGDFWEVNVDITSENVMLNGSTNYWIALAPLHDYNVSGQTDTFYSVDPTTGNDAKHAFPLLYGFGWSLMPCNEGSCFTATAGTRCDMAFRLYGIPFDLGSSECPADLTGDDQVNINDIFKILGLWGNCPEPCPPYCEGDLTEECIVDINDLFEILGQWGDCPVGDPIRACCIYTGPFSTCLDLTETECTTYEDSRWWPDTQCAGYICPPAPPNDTCDGAFEIIIDDPAVFGDTSGFAVNNHDGCVAGIPIQSPTAWFFVVGDGNTLTANLCVTGTGNWDHMMNVFCGYCDGLKCAGGEDDSCSVPGTGWPAPHVTWCSEIDQVYYIAISGVNGAEFGEFHLEVTSDGTPCGNPPPCYCDLDPPCTNTEGEECYTDWDGQTPVEDEFNGGWNSCEPVFSDNLNHVAGGTVCGNAADYISPLDGSYPDCDDVFGDPEALRDTDWYRLNIPDLGGGGASALIDFNAEFFGEVMIFNDACASSINNLVFVNRITNTERCEVIEDQAIDWLDAGSEYVLFVSNLDDDVSCDNSEYEVSISYDVGTPPYQGCQGDPAYFNADVSDFQDGRIVADDLRFNVATTVDEISWVGVNVVFDGVWGPCDPPSTVNMVFDIHYYVDADEDGCPDTPAFASFTGITADSTEDLGFHGFIANSYEWKYNHGDVAFQPDTCYWLEIVGAGSEDDCWFLWHDATQGDAGMLQAINSSGGGYTCPDDLENRDMAWCVYDEGEGVDIASPCGCLP